jgi:hypothetical protein
MAMIAPVATQALQGERRKHDEAILATLTVAHVDVAAGAGDIADAQSLRFAEA